MYQSIPKRVYTTKESAMPKMAVPPSFSAEKNECHTSSDILQMCHSQDITSKPNTSNIAKKTSILKNMETDDLLLIGLLLLFISEDSDQQLLIAVIAFLLFS